MEKDAHATFQSVWTNFGVGRHGGRSQLAKASRRRACRGIGASRPIEASRLSLMLVEHGVTHSLPISVEAIEAGVEAGIEADIEAASRLHRG